MSLANLRRRRAQTLKQAGLVLAGALAVLLGLELVYVIAANLVLRSRMIQSAVAGADGMHLEFDSAYSVLPGRVNLRGLVLRFEDYNVQFQLSIDRGQLDVGLDELLHKRFHCYRVRADGVSFLMRHKSLEASGHGQRFKAYPKIAGFSDPPLYRGSPPPPIPDSEYDLWQVRIEDVVARAKELWFLEYRFRGDAEARGAFVIRPARFVQVLPADLELVSGKLEVGSVPVARKVSGHLSVALPSLDVVHTEGAAVFDLISTQLRLSLRDGDLGFLNVYREAGSPKLAGSVRATATVSVQKGVVQPETQLVVDAASASVLVSAEGDRDFAIDGPATLEAEVTRDHPERLDWSLESERLSLKRSDELGSRLPAPQLSRVSIRSGVQPTDLGKDLKVTGSYLSVGRAQFANLYWLEPWLGAHGKLRVDGRASASAELSCDAEQHCALDRARVDGSGARFAIDDRSSEPFSASISAARVTLPLSPDTALGGEVRVQAAPASALLPLVTSLPIRDAVTSVLGLEDVQGKLLISGTPHSYRLSLAEARSGKLRARGDYHGGKRDDHGALLLATPLVNFGVTLQNGDTSVKPLVADDWPASQQAGRAAR